MSLEFVQHLNWLARMCLAAGVGATLTAPGSIVAIGFFVVALVLSVVTVTVSGRRMREVRLRLAELDALIEGTSDG